MSKQRILVVDDNDINRMIISNMLGEKYELIEAKNGLDAVSMIQSSHGDIDLMLLDVIMPELDGLGVLDVMNKRGWIKDIPVIMISAETSPACTKKAFELGAEDYICRPFDPNIVSRRIQNVILLHAKQNVLMDKIIEEFYYREKQNSIMISILSHIVETRNGESGMHVLHINTITGFLLDALSKRTNKYVFSDEDQLLIRSASSLHDIGKLVIPEEILNKPGKVTDEEFEVIKTHSMAGADMLSSIPLFKDEPLVKYAYEICRWHHERWDGKGYPDGLKGDDIPITAQIVSLADVYDALTSDRCYKKAYTHEKSIEMIKTGECGSFNPILIQCLDDIAPVLKTQLDMSQNVLPFQVVSDDVINRFLNELRSNCDVDVSRNIRLLRNEEERNDVLTNFSSDLWFELFPDPVTISFNEPAAKYIGLQRKISDPLNDPEFRKVVSEETCKTISDFLEGKISDIDSFDTTMRLADGKRCQIVGKVLSNGTDANSTAQSDEQSNKDAMNCAIGRIIPMDN